MRQVKTRHATSTPRISAARVAGITVAILALAGAIAIALMPSNDQSPGVTNDASHNPPAIAASDLRTIGLPVAQLFREHGMQNAMDLSLEVVKSARLLRVFSEGIHIKSYVIALGANPVPPKKQRGDNATPEGLYYVCEKNPGSRYHKSLKLSYPGAKDADRGLDSKLINRYQHDKIVRAIARRRTPPMDTALGGDICIHGGGGGSLIAGGGMVTYDWTEGCIALSDEDVDELFGLIPVGTPVKIRP